MNLIYANLIDLYFEIYFKVYYILHILILILQYLRISLYFEHYLFRTPPIKLFSISNLIVWKLKKKHFTRSPYIYFRGGTYSRDDLAIVACAWNHACETR